MPNQQHLELLQKSTADWNEWREQHPEIRPDLSGADLSEADLSGADLSNANLSDANLSGADLSEAFLYEADLSGADLSRATLNKATLSEADLIKANLYETDLGGADLSEANLSGANLSEANLSGADLSETDLSETDLSRATLWQADFWQAVLIKATLWQADFWQADLSYANLNEANLNEANLNGADLSNADLSNADLSRATLVDTNLTGATLTQCTIYGISVWNVQLDGAKQDNLVITDHGEPTITVDNLEVAQFIYLLLNNPKIRDVIDTIAKKAVLILGRFTPERKLVLEAIRTALRSERYVPILFDFDKPSSQDLTETVSTLAHISCFIIADLTDPSCIPYEVGTIAHNHVKPLQPLFQPTETAHHEFAMLADLRQRYYWILPTYQYNSLEDLITSLQDKVITPAKQKVDEIAMRRKTE